jgi:hydroxymethylbilane synthase
VKRLRIATRKSELALWQANHVAGLLRARYPDLEVELLPMVTRGDEILDRPLAQIGGKGLFLKELERALLSGAADVAVHSMKDVPVEEAPGLVVDVTLERANPFDALLSRTGATLDALPAGARVGTSSLRRQCQIKALRPELAVADLRGNVNTRVRKLDDGEYDAIVLACAGLERLGMAHRITEVLAPPRWLPAATQGTIGVQRRADDGAAAVLLAVLNDADAALRTRAERTVSAALQGSCQLPLAVFAEQRDGVLRVSALVGMPDGSRIVRASSAGPVADADGLAGAVVADLLAQGARDIIAALNRTELN